MKDFMEKWHKDSRFQAKIKLGLYTLFVILVSIFALSSNRGNTNNQIDMDYNDNNIGNNEIETVTIDIPEKYKYTASITINQNNYQYTGTKDLEKETITKIADGVTSNYVYENNGYYKDESGMYVLTTKDEVYNMIGYNYLKLDTINQYLAKSTKVNEEYLVYLKDIILGNDSEEYITITINENKTTIDYTSLMKLFDETIEKYIFEVVIEEIE